MKEAKDTVMGQWTYEEIYKNSHQTALIDNLLKAQAEISFKAGIREVAEWIRRYEHNKYYIFVNHGDWQAQLKEWGIE